MHSSSDVRRSSEFRLTVHLQLMRLMAWTLLSALLSGTTECSLAPEAVRGFPRRAADTTHAGNLTLVQAQFPASREPIGKLKGVLVILARNTDVHDLTRTMADVEGRFNSRFGYPYVFLNDKPFDKFFTQRIRQATGSAVSFGVIPKYQWSYPPWINQTKARMARHNLGERGIIYGDSEAYRFMCRYYSGFFMDHPLLAQYEYFWRIEPHVQFTCTITEDPFQVLHDQNKSYGFNIMGPETVGTIDTLGAEVNAFRKRHPNLVNPENFLDLFLGPDGLYPVDGCHFWSNFEIAGFSFFRSQAYRRFFKFLDKSGGFFYERWGDAPVHTLAAALFLGREQVHFFDNIGYRHEPWYHCPQHEALRAHCDCDASEDFNTHKFLGCSTPFHAIKG